MAEILTYIRFSKMGYLSAGAAFALLTEKSIAEQLVANHLNILIKVTIIVNVGIIVVEALECWQRLKIYRISYMRYLEKRKMEVLCRKIELFMRIQLKTIPYLLISESWPEKYLESNVGKRSAINITMGIKEEAA